MDFFNSAVDVLQTLVIALGAGLGIWGGINLMEGYGNDKPRREVAGHETVYGEVDVTKSRKEKHNPDGTSGTVKKYCGNTRFLL